ncbi:hypothetical protein TNCV_1152481 [Trichonephila clavipes]|nr:hypothetical protein TNCV_1152481 [Trichonephila clavipes]
MSEHDRIDNDVEFICAVQSCIHRYQESQCTPDTIGWETPRAVVVSEMLAEALLALTRATLLPWMTQDDTALGIIGIERIDTLPPRELDTC